MYNHAMKRITSIHTVKGYRFELGRQLIAEGEYSDGKFILIDTDDITEHANGMTALSFLNMKYNPEYYDQPVKSYNVIPPTNVDKFKKHPALVGVTKEVMFAKCE